MKVDSFFALYRQRWCTLPPKAERAQMSDNVVIVYNSEQVLVPKEVADFLERNRKREQAQEEQGARCLSKSEFETMLSGLECVNRPMEDGWLAEGGGERSDLWHLQKMAVSKRLQQLHKKLGSSVMRQNSLIFCLSGLQVRPVCPYRREANLLRHCAALPPLPNTKERV